MRVRGTGCDIETAWNSHVDRERWERFRTREFHLGDVSSPVPPPIPVERGVWVNLWETARAAGVAVLSGVIQVSVRARKLRDLREAWAEINSAISFLVAAWQFQRPPSTIM